MSSVPRFEYTLPQDTQRVAAEASINATLACTINPHLTRLEAEIQAFLGCERLKDATKYAPITNDFDAFAKLTIQSYTEAYLAVQKDYHDNPQNLETAQRELQELGPERALVELSRPIKKILQERGVSL